MFGQKAQKVRDYHWVRGRQTGWQTTNKTEKKTGRLTYIYHTTTRPDWLTFSGTENSLPASDPALSLLPFINLAILGESVWLRPCIMVWDTVDWWSGKEGVSNERSCGQRDTVDRRVKIVRIMLKGMLVRNKKRGILLMRSYEW